MSETAQAAGLEAMVPARRETPRSPARTSTPRGDTDRQPARWVHSCSVPGTLRERLADPGKETLVEMLDRWREEERVTCDALDAQREKPGHLLTHSVGMGTSRSYLTSVTLRWVALNVGHTRDLPIWRGNGGRFGEIPPDEGIEDDLRQCAPDWSRQLPMVRYLATHAHHKFPPIVVVAWQSWVNDPVSHVWVNGTAMYSSTTTMALDSKRNYIDLNYKYTRFYVLDGQHRLMAIQGLQELLVNRRLPRKSPDGTVLADTGITLSEVLEERSPPQPLYPPGTHAHALTSAMGERIGVEIVPAVMQNETFLAAVRRLRSLLLPCA